jgi:hypothetical protein
MDSGPSYEDERRSQEATTRRETEEKIKLDKLTRMLCTLCKGLQEADLGTMTDLGLSKKDATEISAWYTKHSDWDEKRLAAAKKSGLAKLTEDEREALGL